MAPRDDMREDSRMVRSSLVVGRALLAIGGVSLAGLMGGVPGCAAGQSRGPVEVPTTVARPPAASDVDAGDCTAEPSGDVPRPMDDTFTGGSVVLADWGDRTVAFVADAADRALVAVDVDAARVLSSHPLDGEPSALVVTKTGRLIVALRDRSALAAVVVGVSPSAPMVTACRRPTVIEPTGLAIDPDHERLIVVGAAAGRLSIADPSSLEGFFEIDVAPEPRAVAVADEGRVAIVSHVSGSVASVVDLEARQSRAVPLSSRHDRELDDLRGKIGEAVGEDLDESAQDALRELLVELEERIGDEDRRVGGRRRGVQGYAVAVTTRPAGRALLPQVLVDSGGSGRRTEGYGDDHVLTQIPSVAVIDPRIGTAMQSSLRIDHRMTYRNDEGPERCLLPRAAAVDGESGTLLVACLGSDLVVAYDAFAPEPARAERRRWRVAAGPSGIAVDRFDRRAVVWSRFDRVLSVLPLDSESQRVDDERFLRRIEIEAAREPRALELALGEALFHATNDGRLARDGRACASCHPEGGDDGLVWSTPDGPRRTLALAGRLAGTEPYGWDGSDRNLEAHVREAVDRLGGVGGLRSLERRALLRYLGQLSAPPRPGSDGPASKGGRGESDVLRRGREIFESKQAGCSECHRGKTLQDGERHDVGSAIRADRGEAFDTPSLIAVGRGAPYFHDGRYATLEALLEDPERRMGHTRHLAEGDRDALIAYLESL